METARIDRTFDVDIATMWSLWTDPQHLARWFRPSLDEFGPSVASLDLWPGGAYRIEMVRTDGEVHAVAGTVVAVEEPTRRPDLRWTAPTTSPLADYQPERRRRQDHRGIHHTRLVDADDAARHAEAGPAASPPAQPPAEQRSLHEVPTRERQHDGEVRRPSTTPLLPPPRSAASPANQQVMGAGMAWGGEGR